MTGFLHTLLHSLNSLFKIKRMSVSGKKMEVERHTFIFSLKPFFYINSNIFGGSKFWSSKNANLDSSFREPCPYIVHSKILLTEKLKWPKTFNSFDQLFIVILIIFNAKTNKYQSGACLNFIFEMNEKFNGERNY